MRRLTNPVRHYAWGSTEAIPRLLGEAADGRPWAELWMGAHPVAPSALEDGTPLDEALRSLPDLLGEQVRSRYGDRLPYLVKVLAAAEPLSLQVHPCAGRAAEGWAREEALGVPSGSPQRRYGDRNHKPELALALTPFEALCGFRPVEQVRAELAGLDVAHPLWAELLDALAEPDALRAAMALLLGGDARVPELVTAVAEVLARTPGHPRADLVGSLAKVYPGDRGVLVALLLEHVVLAPGEALFLAPGTVHAYLHGTALEVMADSDNVLRAGLTPKHVDVAEVLRAADLVTRPLPLVRPQECGAFTCYRPDVAEFELLLVRARDRGTWIDVPGRGPRLAVVLDGSAQLADATGTVGLQRGRSALVGAADGELRLAGEGLVAVVGVPHRQ